MRHEGSAGRRDEDGARAWLAGFSVLLAAALVLHVLWWHGVAVRSPWVLVVAAALVVVARPASVGRLVLLLLLASVAIGLELPALGSHLLLVLGVAVCVLVHTGTVVVRGRRLPSAVELVVVLRPFLRASVVVLYVAAALSKLNHDYVDAAVTPVAALTAKVLWFAPEALDGATWRVEPAIWGSLLIELSLPVLLLIRRTRTIGLVVGLTFHAVLALAGTVPFTALMLALYWAFLPLDVVPRAASAHAARTRRGDLVAAVGIAAWVVVGTVATVDPGRVTGGALASGTRVLVAAATFALLAAVVSSSRGPGRSRAVPAPATRTDRPPGPAAGSAAAVRSSAVGSSAGPSSSSARASPSVRAVYVAGVVALVLVAAGPYAGVRTGDAFTMYSALDTSPGGWNHLLLPSTVRGAR